MLTERMRVEKGYCRDLLQNSSKPTSLEKTVAGREIIVLNGIIAT